jgi:2-oxo-4-hydroxy-4-carboxy--5-ureidoimidazoline (OHCU) decarboxylase
MTLEQTFFLSQTIAAAAVVISIIYLARQVNQAERVQRAIMQQGRADRSSKASLTTAHPELARIWQKKGGER